MSLTNLVRRFRTLVCIVPMIGEFFQSSRFGLVLRIDGAWIWHESDHMDVIGPLHSRSWTLALSVGPF